MRFTKTIAAAASIAIAAFAFTPAAQADNDDAIIAGAAGFAVGTLFGNATARPHYVPPRAYYAPRAHYAPRYAPRAGLRRPGDLQAGPVDAGMVLLLCPEIPQLRPADRHLHGL